MLRTRLLLLFLILRFPAESGLAQPPEDRSPDPGIEQSVPLAGPHWPQFRGVQASGVGAGNPPAEWDVESGKNIQWKRKMDGLGHSGPIVHGERIFLTTAVSESGNESVSTGLVGGAGETAADSDNWEWRVLCLDLQSGREIWQRAVARGKPTIKRHIKSTHANSTPATDGRHVVACFGSEGLFCLDFEGNVLWKKEFGRLHSGPYDAPELEWGFASSPVIHDDRVILQCDCLNTGFVAILDLKTGNELQRIERQDVATWSTPAVLRTETGTQLICNGYRQMAAYDLKSGERLWSIRGGGDVPVPAPLLAHGLIFLTNGHGRNPLYAVSPSARGDLTPDSREDRPNGLVWWDPRGGSYIPTPIIVEDLLYTCSNYGVLEVRYAKTGERCYRERIGGLHSASAIASRRHVYFCREDGTVSVIRTGTQFELTAENLMPEPVFATPAIVGDRILLRTVGHLFSIGRKEAERIEQCTPVNRKPCP